MPVNFFERLKYRLMELPVWIGIPVLGVFSVNETIFLSKFLVFVCGIFFVVAFVLIFNDWGGYKKVLSTESFHKTHQWMLYLSLLAIMIGFSIGLLLLPWKQVLFLCFFGIILNLLYSHPLFHLKESIIGAKILHLLGGFFLFALGYLVFSKTIDLHIMIGLFFALIFTSGHFIHESIDYAEDKKNNLLTCATKFGPDKAELLAIVFFCISHIFLWLLYMFDVIERSVFWLFMTPFLVHIYRFCMIYRNEIKSTSLENYRNMYRGLYACATLFYVFLNFYRLKY